MKVSDAAYTAAWEYQRRVNSDIREDGECSANSRDHHMTMVLNAFPVTEIEVWNAINALKNKGEHE